MTLASIARARRCIFLENQYFTSPEVTEALSARLREPDGPEVVLISTVRSPSWFDHLTMDSARAPMLWRLQAADRYGRFRALAPRTAGGAPIIVHSKVGIIDDEILRIGSANLNNRSGAFDSECELSVRADTAEVRQQILAFRDELISHFMGIPASTLAAARAELGGLVPAIDRFVQERLIPLPAAKPRGLLGVIDALHFGDPRSAAESWRLRMARLPRAGEAAGRE